MSKLRASMRNALPTGEFGLPAERKYPMPDASHARNAKARASEEYKKGNLTKAEFDRINAKADRILGGK